MFTKFFIFLLTIVSLGVFWHDTGLNYATHIEVKQSSVDHPEFIPTYTTTKMIS